MIRTVKAFRAKEMWRVRDQAMGAAAAMLAIAAPLAYAQSAPTPASAAATATATGAGEAASTGTAPGDQPRRPPAPPTVEEGRFAIILESVPVS